MNKKILSCIIAGALMTCGAVTFQPTVAYAAGAETNQAGPVITVSKMKFLLEVGQKFDFAKELGLKITDAKDGDITKQVKIPEIKTDKVNKFTFTIKATDSKGLTATKDITINVIKIADNVKLNNIEDIKTYDLNKLITGNTQGLTTSLASVSDKDNNFVLKVSDGVNTISKTVKVTIDKLPPIGDESKNKDSKTGAKADNGKGEGEVAGDLTDATGTDKTADKDSDKAGAEGDLKADAQADKSDNANAKDDKEKADTKSTLKQKMPKTGDISSLPTLLGGGVVIAGAGLAYMKSKKRK